MRELKVGGVFMFNDWMGPKHLKWIFRSYYNSNILKLDRANRSDTMRINISKHQNIPMYAQIKAQIIRQIMASELPAGLYYRLIGNWPMI